jgi:hypothetical protein
VTDGKNDDEVVAQQDAGSSRRAVPPDVDDDDLLAALRHAISARQAVPPEFVEAAKNAFAWHDINADLAQLTYDSMLGPAAAPTRAESAFIRALTFSSARLTIELEVTAHAVIGQVVPAQVATIEVQTQAGQETIIASDEIGCFSIHPIPTEAFRLRCQAAAGIDVRTGWITL